MGANLFEKTTRDGKALQVKRGTGIYEDCLEVWVDGKFISRAGSLVRITPGKTPGFKNAPAGACYAINTALFTEGDGRAIQAALAATQIGHELEIGRQEDARRAERHAAWTAKGLDPAEVEAALDHYGRDGLQRERAREAEDVRAYDLFCAIGA